MSICNKHIAIVGLGFAEDYVGGISAYQTQWAYQLQKRGAKVSVIIPASQSNRPQSSITDEGISLYRFGNPPGGIFPGVQKLAAAKSLIQRILQDSPIDLINVHFALSAWPMLRIKAIQSIPKLMHFHGPWPQEWRQECLTQRSGLTVKQYVINQVQTQIERQVVQQMNHIVTMSPAFTPVLTQQYGVSPNCISTIPIGWNGESLPALTETRLQARQRLNLPENARILLTVRRLVHRTGVDMLLEAILPLLKQNPHVYVVIVGKGPEKQALQQQVEQSDVQHQVRFTGFVADEDLPFYYRAADVSCVPTRSLEGFGTIVLESWVQGTPVMATPVGGLLENVGRFSPQLLAKEASAPALNMLLSDWLADNLVLPGEQACRDHLAQSYHWDVVFPQFEAVFQQLL